MATSFEKPVDCRSCANHERDRIVRENSPSASWELLAAWRDHVIGPNAPNWFALESDPRAERVKFGHHRSVFRVKLGDRAVFAKVYDDSANSLLKRIFAKRASEREWRTALEMQRRGIPVVNPIGFGIASGSNQASVFLTEEFAGAVTLSSFWDRRNSELCHENERAVTWSVAQLLANSHERGFVPRDNHPDNILVCVLGSGGSESRLVDVVGAKLRGIAASNKQRANSIGQLDQFFHRVATKTQRLRFLRYYFSTCSEKLTDKAQLHRRIRSFMPGLIEAKWRHAFALARRRDRRLRGDGKYFARIDLGEGWTAIVVLKLARRRIFPEPNVTDRNIADWMSILRKLIADVGPVLPSEPVLGSGATEAICQSLAKEQMTGFLLHWTVNKSSSISMANFEDRHRRRHLDLFAPLWLGALECRRNGTIVADIAIFPLRDEKEMTERDRFL